jgi:hypothetical protein
MYKSGSSSRFYDNFTPTHDAPTVNESQGTGHGISSMQWKSAHPNATSLGRQAPNTQYNLNTTQQSQGHPFKLAGDHHISKIDPPSYYNHRQPLQQPQQKPEKPSIAYSNAGI